MADITIPKGDYGYDIEFTITNADGTPFDLTDYTITFKVWSPDSPDILLVTGSGSSIVEADGTCNYTIAEHNFDTPGLFKPEVELTKTGTLKKSTRPYTLEVTESG